jgi:plasmid stabilization system protein ParE
MARRFLAAAYAIFEELAVMPRMGFGHTFRNPQYSGTRMWRVRGFEKHLILYSAQEQGIRALRLIHGSRHIEQLFHS